MMKNALENFKSSKVEEKREIINLLLSNLSLNDGKLSYTTKKPFDKLSNSLNVSNGADRESCPRGLIGRLVPHHSFASLTGVLRPPLIRSQTPLFGSSSGLFLSPQKNLREGGFFMVPTERLELPTH